MTDQNKVIMRPHRIPRKKWRCGRCGKEYRTEWFRGQAGVKLPCQEGEASACVGADSILWDRPMEYGYLYLFRIANAGQDVDAWLANEYNGRMFPGTRRDRLVLGLELARRWKPEGWREGKLPPVITPRGLFG